MNKKEILDYAVVGGGISGVYAAWRLFVDQPPKSGKPTVEIFETSFRLGGRLLSVNPPMIPTAEVELGGMRYIENYHIWVTSLVKKLKLKANSLDAAMPQNFSYIRGERLRMSELTDADKLPYKLAPNERTPEVLSNITAVAAMLSLGHEIYRITGKNVKQWQDLAHLTPDDWRRVGQEGEFEGIPLYKVPMHYLMLKTLSLEAYKLAQDSSGYDSILHTWNAADGFTWNVGDFGTDVRYLHLNDGFEELVTKLAHKFVKAGGTVNLESTLKSFDVDKKSKLVTMQVEEGGQIRTVTARNLILALPRRALELLDQTGAFLNPSNKKVHKLISSVTPIPLFKLAICYRYPWWEEIPAVEIDGKMEKITKGKSTTDLPVRQCYYWAVDEKTNHAVILIYDDGTDLDYWAGLRDTTEPRFEHNHNELPAGIDMGNWDQFPAPKRMVDEVHRQLVELHGVDPRSVPEPYTAAYRDWGEDPYGGGAAFWPVGSQSFKVSDQILKPKASLPVYICGENYSHEQGWVEGSLSSTENLLQKHLGLSSPGWKK